MNLYNYISSKSVFFTRLADGLFAVIIVVTFIFYRDIFGNINSSFYTFSTIVQGFLALVAFLGTLTVFKIQLIETEAQKVSAGLESSLEMYKGKEVYSYSWIESMNLCNSILSNKESNWQIAEITSGYNKLCKLRDEKSPIRNTMVDFSIVTMVNIMIALIGISLSPLFISKGLFLTNGFYTLLVLSLSFYSIKAGFKVIRSCLGYSFSITIN